MLTMVVACYLGLGPFIVTGMLAGLILAEFRGEGRR